MVICSSAFLSSKTPSAYGLKTSAWKPAETYPWELLRPSFPTPQADATLTDGAASNTVAQGPGEGTENGCTGVCLHGGFSWRCFCLPPWEARFRTSCVTLSSDPYYWPRPPHIFIKQLGPTLLGKRLVHEPLEWTKGIFNQAFGKRVEGM